MQADKADEDSDVGSSLSAAVRLAWAAVLGFKQDSAYTCPRRLSEVYAFLLWCA